MSLHLKTMNYSYRQNSNRIKKNISNSEQFITDIHIILLRLETLNFRKFLHIFVGRDNKQTIKLKINSFNFIIFVEFRYQNYVEQRIELSYHIITFGQNLVFKAIRSNPSVSD